MITQEDIEQEVRRIANEEPDFVYTRVEDKCQYHPDNLNPHGCIIGYAMRNLGHPLDEAGDVGANHAISSILPEFKFTSDWLEEVQFQQDNAETWSDAVNLADRWLEEYDS